MIKRTGVVKRRVMDRGSRDEHTALVLATSSGEFVLRHAEASPLQKDLFAPLVGRRVLCEGLMLPGATFLATDLILLG